MTELLAKTPFNEIIQSDTFTFYVGQEKRPFVVHSKAVAATSQVFDRLLNGGMCEAQTRSAELEDVDPETFIRFLEYAYRHDYTDPSCVRDTCNEVGVKVVEVFVTPPKSELMVPDDDYTHQATQATFGTTSNWGTWTNSRSAPSGFGAIPSTLDAIPSTKKPKRQIRYQAGSRTAFEKREYAYPSHNVSTLPRAQNNLGPSTLPSHSLAPVFLAHARLYTLADMRMVYPLRELALHKLHKALVDFKLHPERLGDIVELAQYAYEHGEDRSEDGKIDGLRDMVVNYIVCEMKVLGKHADFRNLMDSNGELAGDFWDIVSQELL